MSSCGPLSIVVRCWKARSSRTQTATPPPLCAVRSSRSGEWYPFIVDSAMVILSKGSFVSVNCNVDIEGVEGVFKFSKLWSKPKCVRDWYVERERGEGEMRAVVVEWLGLKEIAVGLREELVVQVVAGALDPRTLDVMARGQDRPLLGLAIFRVCHFTRVEEVPRAGVGSSKGGRPLFGHAGCWSIAKCSQRSCRNFTGGFRSWPPATCTTRTSFDHHGKRSGVLYKKMSFEKWKKVVSLIDLKVMKTRNDCEIACDCVKRANVVLHVGLCKEIFARKHTATHKPTSAQPLYSYPRRDIHLIIVCGAPRAYGLQ